MDRKYIDRCMLFVVCFWIWMMNTTTEKCSFEKNDVELNLTIFRISEVWFPTNECISEQCCMFFVDDEWIEVRYGQIDKEKSVKAPF